MSFLSLQTSVFHETDQVKAGGQEEVGLIFGSARGLISQFSVVPEAERFTSCALPTFLEVTGMCFSMMESILDVGAEGPSMVATWGPFHRRTERSGARWHLPAEGHDGCR